MYTELQEAIVITQAALDDLQSTEALERSQQGTKELATESAPAFEAVPPPLQATTVSGIHLSLTSVGRAP